MSRVVITYSLTSGAAKSSLEIDATLSIQHSKTAEVTQVPVESGAVISDHVLLRPDAVKLEGIISNTPLRSSLQPYPGEEEFQAAAEAGQYAIRDVEARRVLEAIHAAREMVTIYSGAMIYTDMVLQALEIPEDASLGDALRFSASFVQIRTVASQVVALPPMTQGKVSFGKQPTKKADTALAGRADTMYKAIISPTSR